MIMKMMVEYHAFKNKFTFATAIYSDSAMIAILLMAILKWLGIAVSSYSSLALVLGLDLFDVLLRE